MSVMIRYSDWWRELVEIRGVFSALLALMRFYILSCKVAYRTRLSNQAQFINSAYYIVLDEQAK